MGGDVDRAEEAVQEAYAVALERWPREGVPDDAGRVDPDDAPSAARSTGCGARPRCATSRRCWRGSSRRPWRTCPATTRDDPRRAARAGLRLLPPGARAGGAGAAHAAARGRAHRARDRPRAAAAEATVAQRLVRAKQKVRAVRGSRSPSRRPTRCPAGSGRCSPCSTSSSTRATPRRAGDALRRDELAAEAIRLARVVARPAAREPEPAGLLALMLLQHSRRAGARRRRGRARAARRPGPRALGPARRSPRRSRWSIAR